MSFKQATLIVICSLGLAGCSTGPIGSADPFTGESVKYNAAIQTINPDPVYAANGAKPGDSGDKGAQAVKRYRSDSVKEVEVMETGSSSPR